MPSKNSVNRPKNKNTARAKAQHKSAVARRKPQTAIIRGKVDSKKVQQKKLRRTRLASALDKDSDAADEEDDVMLDEEEAKVLDKIDTKARKEAKRAAMLEEQEESKNEAAEKVFKMDSTTGKGTTLGGPSPK
ncbi:protein of unknown function [Taphrina deformans PYCC 5710]|uniref:Uncharacterized protein n=1 Tax=Taphrina deformans (strain PYCC 5710 / ATCC 11124 / CBS 356.35 / IMI 108563 / JCM 9778 / NBRC 8474) TaxID=1097556 RepID=R4XA49_TAPDE|nr:protein of unknown function [Taphrina deformans PYCC 5710]|eukprot:CCG82397.1 protein of unknown function [Taphrina deformans PYCC 5710]